MGLWFIVVTVQRGIRIMRVAMVLAPAATAAPMLAAAALVGASHFNIYLQIQVLLQPIAFFLGKFGS